jgi:hypothetical protein
MTPAATDRHPVTSKIINVTPSLARRWLTQNHNNRRIRPDRVLRYCAAMRNGKWTLTNDDICLDPNGNLLNGQHRLEAVVMADIPVMMSIKENVPPETMVNMDRGASRLFGDALHWLGEQNANHLASALKLALALERGLTGSQKAMTAISDDEMITYLHEHPDFRHAVTVGLTACKGSNRVLCPPSAAAVAYWLIVSAGVDPARADYYFEKLKARTDEPKGSAVLAVDNRLRMIKSQKAKYQPRDLVYLLVKGWNYWTLNRPVAKLEISARIKGGFEVPKIETSWLR